MQLSPYVERLRTALADSAAYSNAEAAATAEHLLAQLDPVARLVLLEALSAATAEITGELAPTRVDVRLRGLDPEFVVIAAPELEPQEEPAWAGEASSSASATPADAEAPGETARTTLRLPEALKARIEDAANQEGISVNAWMVRALGAALESSAARRRPTSGRSAATAAGRSTSYTGWAH